VIYDARGKIMSLNPTEITPAFSTY